MVPILVWRKDGYNEMVAESFLQNPLCSRLVGLGGWGGIECKMKTWEFHSSSVKLSRTMLGTKLNENGKICFGTGSAPGFRMGCCPHFWPCLPIDFASYCNCLMTVPPLFACFFSESWNVNTFSCNTFPSSPLYLHSHSHSSFSSNVLSERPSRIPYFLISISLFFIKAPHLIFGGERGYSFTSL